MKTMFTVLVMTLLLALIACSEEAKIDADNNQSTTDNTHQPGDADGTNNTPNQTDESADPTDVSSEPTDESAEPTDESAEPTDESADPTDEPAEPTDEPSAPTDPDVSSNLASTEDAQAVSDYGDSVVVQLKVWSSYRCQCRFDEWGYEDVQECLDGNFPDVSEYNACAEEVVLTLPAPPVGATDYLNCMNSAATTGNTCYASHIEDASHEEDEFCSKETQDGLYDCDDVLEEMWHECEEALRSDDDASHWIQEMIDSANAECGY